MVSRVRFGLVLAFVAATALFSGRSQAQYVTPDSGSYWTPGASGSGFQIEVQDDIIALTFFGYTASGQSTFYILAGVFDVINGRYSGDLIAYSNGQCIGCPYNPPVTAVLGRGSVQFLDRSSAVVTLPRAGGSVQIPIERFNYGYGGNPISANVGVWATTLIFQTALPQGDVVRIFRPENTPQGPVTIGNLYPLRQAVVGAPITLTGTSYNWLWVIDFSATSNAAYFGQFTLEGFRGEYAIYPKGAPIPTRGTTAIGVRVAGANTANQILGAFSPSNAGALDDAAKARMLAQDSGGKAGIELTPQQHAELTAQVRRLEAALPLARELAADK